MKKFEFISFQRILFFLYYKNITRILYLTLIQTCKNWKYS